MKLFMVLQRVNPGSWRDYSKGKFEYPKKTKGEKVVNIIERTLNHSYIQRRVTSPTEFSSKVSLTIPNNCLCTY